MTSIYELKSRFQDLLRPVTGALASAGVTANAVTVAACLCSLAVGACILRWPEATWPLLLVPSWMFLRMALNAIDGMLAREHDMKTALGAILNEMGDVVSDTALYLPFAVVLPQFAWHIVVFAALAILTEMVGVTALQVGASRRYDGPMGKSDRAFALGLLALLLGLRVPLSDWVGWYFHGLNLLCVTTILNRARKALAETKCSPILSNKPESVD